MNTTSEMPGTFVLPEIGNDWVFDMARVYILVCPMLCSERKVVFYTSSLGLTEDFSKVGYFSRSEITADIHSLNNGVSTVAVPVTRTALKALRRARKDGDFDIFSSVQVCELEKAHKNPGCC